MKEFIYKTFKLKEKKSSISQEIIAGIIVFFAIIYTLPVNSSLISKSGMSADAAFTITAVVCAITTLLIGLISNRPFVMNSGAGMNAFFVYTITRSLNYSWQEGLSILLISSILFFILSVTKIRKKIVDAIDPNLKYAISAALGLFLAFIGLNMGGIVVKDEMGLVKLGSLNNPLVLLSLLGMILVLALSIIPSKVNRFSIVISMLIVAAVGLTLGSFGVENMPKFDFSTKVNFTETPFVAFLNFKVLKNAKTYAVIISALFVQLFDATGSLVAVANDMDLLDEDGKLKDAKKIMIADSTSLLIANTLGGLSSITLAESAIATKNGGKSGLSSVVVSILMLSTLVTYPIFSVFSTITVNGESFSPVTSLALIYVGIMLFSNIKNIDFSNVIIAFTSFVIITMTIFTYSIVNGLGIGFIVYIILMFVSKKRKQVNYIMYVITLLYIISVLIDYILVK